MNKRLVTTKDHVAEGSRYKADVPNCGRHSRQATHSKAITNMGLAVLTGHRGFCESTEKVPWRKLWDSFLTSSFPIRS